MGSWDLLEVADVLVFHNIKIPDNVIFFGAGMDDVGLVRCKMNQVDAVLLGVERSLLSSLFAVVDHDLVVLG